MMLSHPNLSTAVSLLDATPTANLDVKITGDKIISDTVLYWVHAVGFGLASVLCLGGMCANVINVIVFCQQGILYDSSNATLLGLAVADFWNLFTSLARFTLSFLSHDVLRDAAWGPLKVNVMVFGIPHSMTSSVTCWITAYLAFERCVCVVFPFRVKTMFSAKRSLIVVVGIFVFCLICYSPKYVVNQLATAYDPVTNRTIVVLLRKKYWAVVENASSVFNAVVLRTFSMLIVLVCTKITVSKVMYSRQWRKHVSHTTVSSNQLEDSSKREQLPTISSKHNDENDKASKPNQQAKSDKETKLVRMITTICIIFLICSTPHLIIKYARVGILDFSFGGRFQNFFLVCFAISFFMDSINASINIFVYYRLSSRYKKYFRRLFRLKE